MTTARMSVMAMTLCRRGIGQRTVQELVGGYKLACVFFFDVFDISVNLRDVGLRDVA